MQDDIYFTVKGHTGCIHLNRPAALNALNAAMVQALYQQLQDWQKDTAISHVTIHSTSARAFCAGGDLKELYYFYKANPAQNLPVIKHYFKSEYALNTLIKHYPKPYTAYLNGLTLGGGAGISLHGTTCIANETFSLAMPETGIGFFPDVGMRFLFSRLPYEIGIYLGLTGNYINAEEALWLNLIQQKTHDFSQENHLKAYYPIIQDCFKYNTISDIFKKLADINTGFTNNIRDILNQKSPTSLETTLDLLRQAKTLDFDACSALDYTLACQFADSKDFYEGIRAAVIDKDKKPKWQQKRNLNAPLSR